MQLFLRQSPDELGYLREALKLTDAEVAQIAHLKTDKRRAAQAYLINGTRGRGTASVRPGPRAYWICTSDPIADVPEREAALRRAGGDAWAALDRLLDDQQPLDRIDASASGRAATSSRMQQPYPSRAWIGGRPHLVPSEHDTSDALGYL
jgi:hypothetical protein